MTPKTYKCRPIYVGRQYKLKGHRTGGRKDIVVTITEIFFINPAARSDPTVSYHPYDRFAGTDGHNEHYPLSRGELQELDAKRTVKVHVLKLSYSINFNDADEGSCYAGEGSRIISVHRKEATPSAIAEELNPILKKAELEKTVYPVQEFNRIIKDRLGFTLNEIDDGYDFSLKVEPIELQD